MLTQGVVLRTEGDSRGEKSSSARQDSADDKCLTSSAFDLAGCPFVKA